MINDDREREELLRRERDEIHALGLNVRLELSDRTAVSLSSLPMAPDSRRNLMLPESICPYPKKKVLYSDRCGAHRNCDLAVGRSAGSPARGRDTDTAILSRACMRASFLSLRSSAPYFHARLRERLFHVRPAADRARDARGQRRDKMDKLACRHRQLLLLCMVIFLVGAEAAAAAGAPGAKARAEGIWKEEVHFARFRLTLCVCV